MNRTFSINNSSRIVTTVTDNFLFAFSSFGNFVIVVLKLSDLTLYKKLPKVHVNIENHQANVYFAFQFWRQFDITDIRLDLTDPGTNSAQNGGV